LNGFRRQRPVKFRIIDSAIAAAVSVQPIGPAAFASFEVNVVAAYRFIREHSDILDAYGLPVNPWANMSRNLVTEMKPPSGTPDKRQSEGAGRETRPLT
jgi:hypothetical protein